MAVYAYAVLSEPLETLSRLHRGVVGVSWSTWRVRAVNLPITVVTDTQELSRTRLTLFDVCLIVSNVTPASLLIEI